MSAQLMSYLTLGIGLCAIYGLLGVAVSTLQETLTGWLSVRASSLDIRLRSLLANTDAANALKKWSWWHRIPVILGFGKSAIAPLDTASPLYKALYQTGVLSAPSAGGQPSYVDKENFAKALVEAIRIAHPQDAQGKSLMEQLRSIIEAQAATTNPPAPAAPPAGAPAAGIPAAGAVPPLVDPNAQPPVVAQVTPVQASAPITAVAPTGQKPSNRLDDPQQRVWNALNAFVSQAGNDLDAFKKYIEDWFDLSMDRLNGIYTRWSRVFSLSIGLILAIWFNINSINIARALLISSPEQQQLVADFAKATLAEVEANKTDVNAKKAALDTAISDLKAAYDAKRKLSELTPAPDDKTVKDANTLIADKETAYEAAQAAYEKVALSPEQARDKISELNLPIGRPMQKSACGVDSFCWTWFAPSGFWLSLFGWLITGLAVSLGSSFWFDTLTKLLDLRSTGTKPVPNPIPQPGTAK
jgi:hypothetical protein